jgi:phage terminase Nu1 subunit (DNA packaging protein)
MEFLTIPESVVGLLKPPTINSDDAKTILKSKCDRRFIAKKYRSIAELRKDDNTTDVFYDKEYDDTPYHLLDKYKDEKKRFREDEQFREFFTETLIQKHDCPEYLAKSLVDTIMAKKKRVKANEYAILEIKPTLASKLREEEKEEEEERGEIEAEAETRKHTEFYRRRNDKWELDNTVDMDSFVDTNTLFCELSESCNKITDVNQCVPNEMAALQMRLSKRARIIEEFDDRIARSFEEVTEELRAGLSQKRKQIRRKITLNQAKLYRQGLGLLSGLP